MEKSKTIIRISRSRNIESSSANAILALDNFQNIIGQPVMVRYYKDSTQTEIDTIVAIGVRNGTGRESYRILYAGTTKSLVNDVWTVAGEAPDVSLLAHGELYIIKNGDGVWCYCYAVNDRRYIEPITGGPYTFLNLSDTSVWYFVDGSLTQDGSYYSRPDIDQMLGEKQDTLISGTNVKTINGYSILGSGNLVVEGGGGGGGGSAIFASGQAVGDTYLSNDKSEITPTSTKLFMGKAIYEYVEEKLSGLYPLTVNVSVSPTSKTVISGSTVSSTLTFSASKKRSDGTSEILTSDTTFYYSLNNGSYVRVTSNPLTILDITGENTTKTYKFKGVHPTYGEAVANTTASYGFGYKYLYGVTSKYSSSNPPNINNLTQSAVTMRTTNFTITVTTASANDFPVFCMPDAWGSVTKVLDQNGYDVTDSWVRFGTGTYTRNLDGYVTVSYKVYQKVTEGIQPNYSYTFTMG